MERMSASRPRTPELSLIEEVDQNIPPPPPPTPRMAFPKPRATLPNEGHFEVRVSASYLLYFG